MTDEAGAWIDSLPLSRKRKNLARDFSDGVMMAEVLHIFHPKLVDLHNYEQGLRIDTKIYNWNTLNQKVFKKIGVVIDSAKITAIANAQPGVVDTFLLQVRDAVTSRQPAPAQPRAAARPKKEKEPLPPVVKSMTDEDREFLVGQILESEKQNELIRALEAKEAKLMELMRIKDAKIMKLMAKRDGVK
jgi:ribosomal protein L12E/L44/L45/RPP1/RPP2